MAGGEGTRLRPMTANQPKPLLPVANRPIMEHVLRLLKRHGFDETVVTVQFLAALVRNYFGDGEEFGMSLQYATEEMPLGTAGSVRNAEDALRDEPFLVISGDALTDMDLTGLVRFHKEKGALVTVALAKVPDPLEFGIVITEEDGQIQRFLEKPTWGQVFSDTVNTGIYVMEPEVLAEVPPGQVVDWSADVFPKLLDRGAPLYGYVSGSYWEDVGTHESYLKVQADVLAGRVQTDIAGFEVSPGVWVAEGAEVDTDAVLTGPLCIGDYAKIEAGAHLREYTVIGSNVVVKEGAFLHRAVVHNNVYIGQGVTLRGCVIGKNTDVMRLARIEEGAVVGDECVIEPEAYLSAGVKVYPFKTIEAGAVVNTSVIWESRGQRTLLRPARRVRPGQRGGHPRARGPAGQRLRHHAAQGLHRHHLAGRVPGRPDAQAGGAGRAQRQRDQRRGPGGPAAARWPGSRPPGTTTAAASRCAPRRATRSRSTSSSWTSAAPSCPRPTSASWSGCSPGRSSGGPSPARSPSSATRPGWWSPTPTSCCGAST